MRLGRGILNWFAHERESGRYGAVNLHSGLHGQPMIFPCYGEGRKGVLLAVVHQTRESPHSGDWRGNEFTKPEVGDVFVLGKGTLFYDRNGLAVSVDATGVGVVPDNAFRSPGKPRKKKMPWLDPEMLYRCHRQTVELWFFSVRMPKTR